MTTQTWIASDALKVACDKGHNWITARANKFKVLKNGYNKIQPRMLPKGLTTFKREHCEGFDEDNERDNFLKGRNRIHSVDVIDNHFRAQFCNQYNVCDGEELDFRSMNIHDVDENKLPRRKSEAVLPPSNIELKVMAQSRHKRRNSRQNTKIIIETSEDGSLKILPSVLLTYNEKFINIGGQTETLKKIEEPFVERVYVFRARTDSMKSIDI